MPVNFFDQEYFRTFATSFKESQNGIKLEIKHFVAMFKSRINILNTL